MVGELDDVGLELGTTEAAGAVAFELVGRGDAVGDTGEILIVGTGDADEELLGIAVGTVVSKPDDGTSVIMLTVGTWLLLGDCVFMARLVGAGVFDGRIVGFRVFMVGSCARIDGARDGLTGAFVSSGVGLLV